MIQVASDVSGVAQNIMLKKHRDELILNMGEGTLIKKRLAEGSIKKRAADTRAEVEVTTLKPTMVEPEPSDNSGDEEQHSPPEVPMSFSEVADMEVADMIV